MPTRSSKGRPPPAPPDWLQEATMPTAWGHSSKATPASTFSNRAALYHHLQLLEDSNTWRATLQAKLAAPGVGIHCILKDTLAALPVRGGRYFTTVPALQAAISYFLENPICGDLPSLDEVQAFLSEGDQPLLSVAEQVEPESQTPASPPRTRSTATSGGDAPTPVVGPDTICHNGPASRQGRSFLLGNEGPEMPCRPSGAAAPPAAPSGIPPLQASRRRQNDTPISNPVGAGDVIAQNDLQSILKSMMQEISDEDGEDDPGSQILVLLEELGNLMASPTPPPHANLMFRTLQVALKAYMRQQEKMRAVAKNICKLMATQPRQMDQNRGAPQMLQKATYAAKAAAPKPPKPRKTSTQLKSAQAQALERKKALRCDARTLRLSPHSEAQRLSSFSLLAAGNKIQSALRSSMPQTFSTQGRFLEDVRRNHKGLLFFQLSQAHLSDVVDFFGLCSDDMESTPNVLNLDTLGSWSLCMAPESQVYGMLPFVMSRIPVEVSDDEFVCEFATSNAYSFQMSENDLKNSIKAPRRLNRRQIDGGWTLSTTMCFYVTPQVADKLKNNQSAVYGYNIVAVTPYNQPRLRCLKCGLIGSHLAKDCRGKPKCRHCQGEHDTRCCPTSVPPASTSSTPPMTPLDDPTPKRVADASLGNLQTKTVRLSPGANQGEQ